MVRTVCTKTHNSSADCCEDVELNDKGYNMINYHKKLQEKLKKPEFAKLYKQERLILEIAVELAKIREKNGLTQSELARMAELTQQQVSKLENGISFNVTTLLKVCSVLHVKLCIAEDTKEHPQHTKAAAV